MCRTTMILIALALFALAAVPAMAVDWVLDSSVPGGPWSVSPATGPFSATTADMPSWATFTGTAIPDVRVTYHITAGNYGVGNCGLALWLGATPSTSVGLFGGKSGQWFGLNNIGLGASIDYPNYYPFTYDSNNWDFQASGFDVDTQVVTAAGVTTVSLAVTNTDGPPWMDDPRHTVSGTFNATSSVSAWAGNSKLAAFDVTSVPGTEGYGQTVSNIKFYKNALTVAHGAMSGVVHLNGTTPGVGATVRSSDSTFTTTVTATDGSYSFPTMAVGTYTMVAHLAGYADQTVTGVVVNDALTTTQNFKLAGGKVAGSVTVAGGATGKGVTVRTSDSAYTTTTGTDGTYTLGSLPPGTYTLVASQSPFADTTANNVVVTDEHTTTQNFTMPLNLGPGQAGIVGNVTSSLGGLPLGDVRIKADLAATRTDVLGNYVLIASAGDIEEFGAQATKYTPQLAPISLTAGQTIVRNFALVHQDTWDLSDEFNGVSNPNGQWSFGNVNGSVMTLYPVCTNIALNQWPVSWKSWNVGPDLIQVWGLWFAKNTTGAPIVVADNYVGGSAGFIPEFVVENGETSYGGQWDSYGRSSLRWTYPYSDQRFMSVHVDMKNQYLYGSTQSLGIYQNNALLTTKSVSGFAGFAGFAGTSANGYADSIPAWTGFAGTAANNYTDSIGSSVAGTPTLAYDTSLLLNPGDVVDFSYSPGDTQYGGYRASIHLEAVISPGSGVVVTSIGAVLARPESLTTEVALTTPVVLSCDTTQWKDSSFYVQSTDRTVGMKCLGNVDLATCAAGTRITMNGKVTHDASGQKVFQVDMITSQVAGDPPKPLGIGSKTTATTLSPRNMLVKVWGKLTQKNPADIGPGPFDLPNTWPWNYWIINDGGQDIKLPLNVQAGWMCPPYIPDAPINSDYFAITGIATLDSTGQPVVLPLRDASFADYTAAGR